MRLIISGFIVSILLVLWSPDAEARRVALVIGNSAYQHVTQLDNPQNDAVAISTALQNVGFDVQMQNDLGFGAFHGGDGSAPPPLALFTGALIGCIMTQIRAFSKRLSIPIGEVEVNARLHWEGTQQGRDPYVTAPVGFHLDVNLDSDATAEEQQRLLDAAKRGCFIEQTLKQGLEVSHRLKVGENWQDA